MMSDSNGYEDQPLDEYVYGKCKMCGQLEELNADDHCFVCEGLEKDKKFESPWGFKAR